MAIKVKLRQKSITGGRQGLYLDFYPPITDPKTGKQTRREFLNMFLFDEVEIEAQKYFDENGKEQRRFVPVLDKRGEPKKIKLSPLDKQHNKDIYGLAEQIRQNREHNLNKPEIYTGYEKEQLKIKERGEKNFVEYFKALVEDRTGSTHDSWLSAYKYLEAFTDGNKRFDELTETFLEEFKNHLLTTKSNKSDKTTLSQNSAVSYFNKVKAALKQAYKDQYLSSDLNARIKPVKQADTHRNFLTIEELNKPITDRMSKPFIETCSLVLSPYRDGIQRDPKPSVGKYPIFKGLRLFHTSHQAENRKGQLPANSGTGLYPTG